MNSFSRVVERTLLLLMILLVSSGCERVRPIYQVENHPIPQLTTPLTLKQIETRIIKAGKLRKWRIGQIEPGRLRGLISWRRHSAMVTIEFDQRFFSIRYKSSNNLLAGRASEEESFTGKQVIHRKYNSHVRALEMAIDYELSFPGS